MTSDDAHPLSDVAEKLLSCYAVEDFSALGEYSSLLIDARIPYLGSSADEGRRLCQVLMELPCPTIGLTGDGDTALPVELLSSLDVLVATEQDAQPLIRNIRRAPLAAMILVQLLRHSEGAIIQDGLFAESLAYATLQGGSEFQNWLANRKPETAVDGNCHEPAVLADLRGNELYLTLNRPDSRNAFSVEMRDELVEGLMLLASDPSIERAIISGVGPCFERPFPRTWEAAIPLRPIGFRPNSADERQPSDFGADRY